MTDLKKKLEVAAGLGRKPAAMSTKPLHVTTAAFKEKVLAAEKPVKDLSDSGLSSAIKRLSDSGDNTKRLKDLQREQKARKAKSIKSQSKEANKLNRDEEEDKDVKRMANKSGPKAKPTAESKEINLKSLGLRGVSFDRRGVARLQRDEVDKLGGRLQNQLGKPTSYSSHKGTLTYSWKLKDGRGLVLRRADFDSSLSVVPTYSKLPNSGQGFRGFEKVTAPVNFGARMRQMENKTKRNRSTAQRVLSEIGIEGNVVGYEDFAAFEVDIPSAKKALTSKYGKPKPREVNRNHPGKKNMTSLVWNTGKAEVTLVRNNGKDSHMYVEPL